MCAKSKGFFGLRRGSTKSLTFQVLDGQQITKDRVSEVRNPQTRLQMVQRVILLTACQAYSLMKELVDHSLEGIQYGAKTQQAFMTANIRMLREKVAAAGTNYGEVRDFTPLGSTHFALNNYLISKGTLTPIEYALANGVVFAGGATYADVIAAIKGQVGDQLTFLCVIDTDNAGAALRYCRVILQPQDAAGNNLALSTPFIVDGKVNAPNLRNEMTEDFTFSLNGVENRISVKCKSDWDMAYAIIASRKYDGAWLRSTQTLLCSEMFDTFTMDDAIDSLNTQILATSNRYLNNAGAYGNKVSAEVESIKGNGVELADGATIDEITSLVITGSNLSTEGVQVIGNGNVYEPLSATATEMTFSLASSATVVVKVNGKTKATYYVAIENLESIVKVTNNNSSNGSVITRNSYPANFPSVSVNTTNEVIVYFNEELEETDLSKLSVSGADVTAKRLTSENTAILVWAKGVEPGTISVSWNNRLVAVIPVS